MIGKATQNDWQAALTLSRKLWPDSDPEKWGAEFSALLENPEAAVFLDWQENTPMGYAQCQLRRDYVEGCEASPVGYLEGLYVEPEHRGTGLAGRLLERCQEWSREMGCREFASDCELENEQSRRFHLKNGFEEANRIICFVKKL